MECKLGLHLFEFIDIFKGGECHPSTEAFALSGEIFYLVMVSGVTSVTRLSNQEGRLDLQSNNDHAESISAIKKGSSLTQTSWCLPRVCAAVDVV